jgi:hypothetical protein
MSDGQPPASSAGHNGGVPARAGDSDREAADERLRVAAGEGRIDLTELEDRLERAFAAKTYCELSELLADLPPGHSFSAELNALQLPETLILDTTETNINLKQSGRWVVPPLIVAKCARSLIRIDFTQASCEHREVVVEASCGTGWITLIVPHGWAVVIDASSTNTANIHNKAHGPVDPNAPRITVIGHPRLGYVRIKRPR